MGLFSTKWYKKRSFHLDNDCRMLSRFARLRKVARALSVASPRVNQQVILRRSLATTSSAPKIIQFALSDIGEGTKEVVVKGI